jgi:multidrug efflux pump subunit AcrA (membrane-fusion protein)
VKNFYAGTVLAVSKKEGDAVRQGEPHGAYRLADAEAAAIREALDDTPLRAKVSQLLEQEMQIRNQAAQVEQLRNAVQAGYESPLRLESAQAGLELLQAQRDETRKARDDIASAWPTSSAAFPRTWAACGSRGRRCRRRSLSRPHWTASCWRAASPWARSSRPRPSAFGSRRARST